MNKATLACFSLVVLLLSCGVSSACPAAEDCPATEIAVNSFGISGSVVLAEGGRERRAGRVFVDAFYLRQGEWQQIGSITGAVGGFGWKAEWRGRYKFVVRHEGVKAATLIINVRSLRGRWNEMTIPLKVDGCASARLTRAGVK